MKDKSRPEQQPSEQERQKAARVIVDDAPEHDSEHGREVGQRAQQVQIHRAVPVYPRDARVRVAEVRIANVVDKQPQRSERHVVAPVWREAHIAAAGDKADHEKHRGVEERVQHPHYRVHLIRPPDDELALGEHHERIPLPKQPQARHPLAPHAFLAPPALHVLPAPLLLLALPAPLAPLHNTRIFPEWKQLASGCLSRRRRAQP